jgi:hypothetical protein
MAKVFDSSGREKTQVGASGDSITVNGVAVVDADLDDATPAAPAGDLNVKWQKDAASPANISAYVDASVLEPLLTLGNLAGTLAEAKGGTAQTTYTRGDLLYSDVANSLAKLPIGAAGRHLASDGSDPVWAIHRRSKSVHVENPANGDRIVMWMNEESITIDGVSFVSLAGTDVDFDIEHNTTFAAGGTVIHTDTATSASGPEWDVTPSGDQTVPTDSLVMLDIVDVAGSVTDFHVTVHYHTDAA